jgi:hypothetical protein
VDPFRVKVEFENYPEDMAQSECFLLFVVNVGEVVVGSLHAWCGVVYCIPYTRTVHLRTSNVQCSLCFARQVKHVSFLPGDDTLVRNITDSRLNVAQGNQRTLRTLRKEVPSRARRRRPGQVGHCCYNVFWCWRTPGQK